MIKIKKTCITCGKEFSSFEHKNQKCCSKACSNKQPKAFKKAICSHCKSEFEYKIKHKRVGEEFWCPSCVQHNRFLKCRYNISLYDYEELLSRQDGVCAICKTANRGYKNRQLSVDHDHKTNIIRGLLCDNCNNAISKLEDNPKYLQNAILYLIKSQNDRSWDRYFINIAALVATRSKDISIQVGAVVVLDKTIISTGYNGFPRKCDDNKLSRFDRPEKYLWICNAEENAVINCSRNGISSSGATIYITPLYPCAKCTRAIIQSGIKRVVYQSLFVKEKWKEEFEISKQMMKEANIEFIEII